VSLLAEVGWVLAPLLSVMFDFMVLVKSGSVEPPARSSTLLRTRALLHAEVA